MTLVAHYVADDFVNGLWQPRAGALGAYVTPGDNLQTAFPASRTRFRKGLYLPDGTDMMANVYAPNLAPVLGGGTTFEALVFFTKDNSNFDFTVQSATTPTDGIDYNFNAEGVAMTLLAGGVQVFVEPASPWPDVSGWHYLTFVIDLSVPGAQTLKIYDSATLVVSQTFNNATLAANLATWSFLTVLGNVEIQSGAGAADATGILEWAMHSRVISAAEVTFRTTYFRVLNQ